MNHYIFRVVCLVITYYQRLKTTLSYFWDRWNKIKALFLMCSVTQISGNKCVLDISGNTVCYNYFVFHGSFISTAQKLEFYGQWENI